MKKSTSAIILSKANLGYELGEQEIDKDLKIGQRGDMLADFISFEIKDVIEGIDDKNLAKLKAIKALEKSLTQIQNVIDSINSIE